MGVLTYFLDSGPLPVMMKEKLRVLMKKSLLFTSVLVLSVASGAFAQVAPPGPYPPHTPQAPPSQRSKWQVQMDIKKLEAQVTELERAIHYERTGAAPSHALIQSYEQQILLIRQQLVRLNIEYANARP